jgi:SNF2 family DNA or RNA helicase
MAYEKQGIARAWRSGQTKQVKVVRFLCRDTVEEKMALR